MILSSSRVYLFVFILLVAVGVKAFPRSEGSRNIGDPCGPILKCIGLNMICNNQTKACQCETGYNLKVQTGIPPTTQCLKPAKLGEMCYHDKSCISNDPFSKCAQINQKALCECEPKYHTILDQDQLKCVPETELLNSDLATFIGVGVGMTLFCGLTCLVLRIFARARFGSSRHHHYANAHLAPPITLSTDHAGGGGGEGTTATTSRRSSQRSSITGTGSRRQSMLAPPARPGDSRRASNSSIRSTSSARSYSFKNHYQHRPSDPETHLSPYKFDRDREKAGCSSSSATASAHASPNPSTPHGHSPKKGSRSSSTGALGVGLTTSTLTS